MDRLARQRQLFAKARSLKGGRVFLGSASTPAISAKPDPYSLDNPTPRKKVKGDPRGPKPPSAAQWGKLRLEMDLEPGRVVTNQTVISYVRFANAYYQGQLTSIHFMLAIDLWMRGRNAYGTAADLVAFSMGEDLPPPDMRSHYAGFKRRKP